MKEIHQTCNSNRRVIAHVRNLACKLRIPTSVNSFADTGYCLRAETGIYHRPVFDCRDVMTDRLRRVPCIILSGSPYVWYTLYPFREIRMLDYERTLCESHRTTPQIHDHSNVSWCQSSCINIIHWPSFNYAKGIRCSLSRARTVFATYRRAYSIQYGYYRTRYTRPTYQVATDQLYFPRHLFLFLYPCWKNSCSDIGETCNV